MEKFRIDNLSPDIAVEHLLNIQSDTMTTPSMNYPNIFTSQSKEFSQDAFIDWLLRCADPTVTTDASIRKIGVAFLEMLVEKHNELIKELKEHNIQVGLETIALPEPISSVQVRRQFLRIDVLGQVNGETGLNIVFENKLGTGIHDDQLRNYREKLHTHYKVGKGKILGVYYKVMEEMDYEHVRHFHQYCTISREEMMEFLDHQQIGNPILTMYRKYLAGIHEEITKWETTPAEIISKGDKWHDGMWNGLLSSLYKELKVRLKGESTIRLGWGWVNNVAGGFHGLWLGNWEREVDLNTDKPTVYLQCDEHELKVRMAGERTGATMHAVRAFVSSKYVLRHKTNSANRTTRMQHKAHSAEIGNLGSYIQENANGTPDPAATAQYILNAFEIVKVATKNARR